MEHAGLHRVGADIVDDRVDLRRDKLWTQLKDLYDADSILRRDRCDSGRAINAECGEGLKIRLYPRACSGIGTGDRQRFSN